jgi:hypothetical protein
LGNRSSAASNSARTSFTYNIEQRENNNAHKAPVPRQILPGLHSPKHNSENNNAHKAPVPRQILPGLHSPKHNSENNNAHKAPVPRQILPGIHSPIT